MEMMTEEESHSAVNFEPLLPQLGKDQLGITKDDDDDGSDGDDDVHNYK